MKRNSQLIDSIIDHVHAKSGEWIPLDELATVVGIATLDAEPATFPAHLKLCVEAGWLEVQKNPQGIEKPDIARLTWAGHNAVEAGQARWQ